MTIAIIGASGFIGNRIFQSLVKKNNNDLIGTFFKHKEDPKFFFLDITSRVSVEKFLSKNRPDVIFWIAGSKNLKKCEKNWKYAYQINTQPIKDYYQIKSKINLDSKLVFFSTDYVFNGIEGYYKDKDTVDPKTNYGITNKLSEEIIIKENKDDLIIRTSAVMGKGGTFFDWINKSLCYEKNVEIYKDIFFSPTPIKLLCEAAEHIIKNNNIGIVHICGGKRFSRFEFTKNLLNLNKNFSAKVIPINSAGDLNHFQHDLSLIPSDVCEKFQTKEFLSYIKEELLL